MSIHWQARTCLVQKIIRTYCSGGQGGLSLGEHWLVNTELASLHVYSVEYGAAGFRIEKWWWLGAIDPDPRGFMSIH